MNFFKKWKMYEIRLQKFEIKDLVVNENESNKQILGMVNH